MTTELTIFGTIGSDWWSGEGITDVGVRDALMQLDPKASKHTVRINSLGGNVDHGLTIMNLIRAHKAQLQASNKDFVLETICDGYAMSAASIIFMAGDIRTVSLGGIVMIHDAWNGCYGNAIEMRKMAENLDMVSQNIADIYASLATPAEKDAPARDANYFRNLMKEETYMTGSEAVAQGIATNLDTALTAAVDTMLTPEKMKGRYVPLMTSGYQRRTFTKASASQSLVNAKLANERLNQMLATVNTLT